MSTPSELSRNNGATPPTPGNHPNSGGSSLVAQASGGIAPFPGGEESPRTPPDPRRARLEGLCRELLALVDPDPSRPDLADTPRRWASWWLDRIDTTDARMETTFASTQTDQMVVVSGMRVWSLCEHHLLPFWCDVSIGYVTSGQVLGLSKFARIAHHHARKLQVQERLVQDIAHHVAKVTGTEDVAVIARGEHLCMTMRGIRTPALMMSSHMGGVFRADVSARAEFLALTGAPTTARHG